VNWITSEIQAVSLSDTFYQAGDFIIYSFTAGDRDMNSPKNPRLRDLNLNKSKKVQ
jgi:hypothetical protein